MYAKRVKLTNVGRHRSLDLSLTCGLIGIFGPNGCGKSTVVDAIAAAVTGAWSRFDGNKEDNICLLAAPGEESSIYVELEHNGCDMQLYRGLRPSKQWLKIGDRTWTKTPEIQRELEQRLGTAFKLLNSHVFVAQWQMFDFIAQTPGERAGAFQLLCKTEKAADICKAIDTLLEEDPELTVEIVDTSDELLVRIGHQEEEVATQQVELDAAKKGLLPEEKVARARQLQQLRRDHIRITGEIVEVEKRIATAQVNAERANTAKATADAAVAALAQQLAAAQPLADAARLTLQQLENYQANQRQRDIIQKQLAALAAEAKGKKAPALHPQDAEMQALDNEAYALRTKMDEYQTTLATFEAEGVVKCPTCGTTVEQLDEHLTAIRAEIPQIDARVDEITKITDAIQHLRDNVAAYTKWKTDWDKRKAAADARMATVKDLPVVEGNVEDLQAQIDNVEVLETHMATARNRATAAASAAAREQATLVAAEGELARLNDQLGKTAVDDGLLERATKALERHENARVAVATAEAQLKAAQRALKDANDALTALKARLARNAKARRFAERLKRLRDDVFHRQALPQFVAQANLQDMEQDINANLGFFGDPFWVETAEDLTFTAHLPGMPAHSAGRLSGGQKSVLAVAFRSALGSLFDAEIGMMTLDEPTAGMDGQNVSFLAAALGNYAAQIRGKRQVILITHAADLRPAFDQVVELGGNGEPQ